MLWSISTFTFLDFLEGVEGNKETGLEAIPVIKKTFKRTKNKCNYKKHIKDDNLLSYSRVTKSSNTQV